MKTVTEKRFFEWHEDDVAVTLRNKGGSYGGGARCLSFALLIWSRMITRKQVMNDVWTMDEKWGLTMYIHHNLANTLAARDYKQPQMVVMETNETDDRNDSRPSNSEN